ncbi:type II toxin-antitoxin system death-on-curing family toxin [Devosia sp. YIM 151766]|uniref:type II toxin-antitoxin system death-on-curing family toxin n=1 Tax=Devosia sp. YIM 151766 TaxID=3017325 RepID=UPI00255D037F|nr:type II toxin-antitoxin system death-on-curing family toxin [Devosia sp. YIM 151766]WIY53747.1 type II toxin-antitoxin system death-on-curing family toxin [Devosia sp. YIM 151766]
MTERIYLTLDDIIWIHDEQIRHYGGASGIRDEGLVLSALLRPQTGYYADVIEEAAALWESLAMNHGFIDGNKRVAFAATIIFLQANGVEPLGSEQEWIEFIYSNLEAGTFRKEVLESWLHAHTGPLEP